MELPVVVDNSQESKPLNIAVGAMPSPSDIPKLITVVHKAQEGNSDKVLIEVLFSYGLNEDVKELKKSISGGSEVLFSSKTGRVYSFLIDSDELWKWDPTKDSMIKIFNSGNYHFTNQRIRPHTLESEKWVSSSKDSYKGKFEDTNPRLVTNANLFDSILNNIKKALVR